MRLFNQVWGMIAVSLLVFYVVNFPRVASLPVFRIDPSGWANVFGLDFLSVSFWYLVCMIVESKHALWLKALGIVLCSFFVVGPLYINLRVFWN